MITMMLHWKYVIKDSRTVCILSDCDYIPLNTEIIKIGFRFALLIITKYHFNLIFIHYEFVFNCQILYNIDHTCSKMDDKAQFFFLRQELIQLNRLSLAYILF